MDLMSDGPRTQICEYGIEHNMVTFQSPFTLSQGGQGIVVRNPVFLEDPDGGQRFWGFTIAIIRVPDIFRDTIDSLTQFGFYYRLSVATMPTDLNYNLIDSSGVAFTDAASFTVAPGNCSWKLEVMPIDGLEDETHHNLILFSGLTIVLLLTALVSTLLFLEKGRRRLLGADSTGRPLRCRGKTSVLPDVCKARGGNQPAPALYQGGRQPFYGTLPQPHGRKHQLWNAFLHRAAGFGRPGSSSQSSGMLKKLPAAVMEYEPLRGVFFSYAAHSTNVCRACRPGDVFVLSHSWIRFRNCSFGKGLEK